MDVTPCACSFQVCSSGWPSPPVCSTPGTPRACRASSRRTATDSSSTASSSTSEAADTSEPGLYGNCGWYSVDKYYACASDGAEPGLEDPDGIDPIQCPDGLVEGAPCTDANGPIDSIGCCTATGELYFCDTQSNMTIYYQNCGP